MEQSTRSAAGGRRPAIDEVFGDRARVRIRVWGGRDEVCAEVSPTWAPADAHRIRLRTTQAPYLSGAPRSFRRWSMVAGLPPRWAAWHDPFQWLARQAGELLFRGVPCGEEGSRFDARAAPEIMRGVRAAIRTASWHAARSCDADARTAVMRFSSCVRWWLYERLYADESGRLRQLARAAPGAVIFAFALDESSVYRPVATQLLEDVREGRPLNALLDHALERWADRAPHFIARLGAGAGSVWERLLEANGEERTGILQQQRLLIRRAGPRVAPTHLLLPPPLRFAPEDIPRGVRDNAHWFRVMKGSAATMRVRPGEAESVPIALSRFASRAAREIRAAPRCSVPDLMRMLSLYCASTGREPARNTPARALVDITQVWFQQISQATRATAKRPSTPARVLNIPLPVDDTLSWADDRLVVRPLRTVGELFDEGERMHNCVARRAPAVLSHQVVICHCTYRGEPHTLEARRTREGWTLADVRGFANASPPADILDALTPWMEARNVTERECLHLDESADGEPAELGDVPF